MIFIRHAESVSNVGGLTMPHAAIPLSELGRRQAIALAETLPANPPCVLVTDMVRTQETAAPYCARFGITPHQNEALNEFSVIDASLIAGMMGPQRRAFVRSYWENPDPYRRWGAQADTFIEFVERVQDFIGQMDKLDDGTVVFGHGIWLAMLHWLMEGHEIHSADDMRAFRAFQLALSMPNCAVFDISYLLAKS